MAGLFDDWDDGTVYDDVCSVCGSEDTGLGCQCDAARQEAEAAAKQAAWEAGGGHEVTTGLAGMVAAWTAVLPAWDTLPCSLESSVHLPCGCTALPPDWTARFQTANLPTKITGGVVWVMPGVTLPAGMSLTTQEPLMTLLRDMAANVDNR